MRVWYQLFIFDVSGIGLANKVIQIAKLALGISEQNFQKTAIVQSKARLMSQFSHQSETEAKNTSTEDFMAILERNSAILQQATEKNQELAAKQNESKQSTEATGSKI